MPLHLKLCLSKYQHFLGDFPIKIELSYDFRQWLKRQKMILMFYYDNASIWCASSNCVILISCFMYVSVFMLYMGWTVFYAAKLGVYIQEIAFDIRMYILTTFILAGNLIFLLLARNLYSSSLFNFYYITSWGWAVPSSEQ